MCALNIKSVFAGLVALLVSAALFIAISLTPIVMMK
jgi:hypothetical protein